MIIVKDLSVERLDKKIFENINLSIASGCITILKGKNGSGKTTLLKAILNIIEPSAGSVFWKGKFIAKSLVRTIGLKKEKKTLNFS